MVKPILLAKMLHCKIARENSSRVGKSKQKLRKKRSRQEPGNDECSDLSKVKIEKFDFEVLQNICRVCLKEGNIPIFDDSTDDLGEALTTFAGVEVLIDDGYPKFLCQNCLALVRGAILLRKTALESDQILRSTAQNLEHLESDEILKAPRNKPASPLESKQTPNFSISFEPDDTGTFHDSDESSELKEKEIEIFCCRKCDIKFQTKNELTEHRISDEHGNKRFTCKLCNKSYSAQYYKRHMSLHEIKTAHICDICGKNFKLQGPFTRHRMTHFYSLPFKCRLCPYRGRFSESLKMHMRSHTGEKPYQCTECPGRFVNKSNLNKHVLTHKAQHDYKCDACGRGFYTKRNLEMHFKVDHTGLKEHVCNICGKAFGYRKQMMKHQLKVHKREKLRSGRLPLYLVVESRKQKGEDIE